MLAPKLGIEHVTSGVEAEPEVGAGKSDDVGAGAVVVVAPLTGAVVVASEVAVVPAGVEAAGFVLNNELAPIEVPAAGAALKRLGADAPDAGALLPPREKRLLAGAPDPELAGAKLLMPGACEEVGAPPRLNDGGLLACEEAGAPPRLNDGGLLACEEAGAPPRLNDGGLLAGVEEGVLLPSENIDLAASWP